jgi:hypothetical protein
MTSPQRLVIVTSFTPFGLWMTSRTRPPAQLLVIDVLAASPQPVAVIMLDDGAVIDLDDGPVVDLVDDADIGLRLPFRTFLHPFTDFGKRLGCGFTALVLAWASASDVGAGGAGSLDAGEGLPNLHLRSLYLPWRCQARVRRPRPEG